MLNQDDTICAISTPPGVGAIAVIRCSGPLAFAICDKIIRTGKAGPVSEQAANTIRLCTVMEGNDMIDQVMVSVFRKPHSYTGDDLVEISCHGSPYIQKKILELLVAAGARPATAGEFTMRAFMNGKLDLTQVEAIGDLITSGSRAVHRVAVSQMRGGFTREIQKMRARLLEFTSLIELELDFSEEDVEFADRSQLKVLLHDIMILLKRLKESFTLGNVIKKGIPVAIAGRTNAGKSTLLNLLLSEERAIVSEFEGTTRDSIEDVISIRGVHFRLIDTAGLRHTEDAIEKLGIERSWQKIKQASVIIHLLDAKNPAAELVNQIKQSRLRPENDQKRRIVVLNKTDLLQPEKLDELRHQLKEALPENDLLVLMSAKTGANLSLLEDALMEASGINNTTDNDVIITNVRHFEALDRALSALERAENAMDNRITADLLAEDIREALHYLGEITGEITNDEILGNIFRNFCIGK